MSEFLGMDTEAADAHAADMTKATQSIDELALRARLTITTVHWVGPDADNFRADAQDVFDRLQQWTADCEKRAEELRAHVEEQQQASDSDGGMLAMLQRLGDLGKALDALQPSGGKQLGEPLLGDQLDVYDNPRDDIAPITKDNFSRPGEDELLPPTSMENILENLHRTGGLQGDDATNIRIQEVVGPDGEKRYIVYVPGSYGNPVNIANPLDTGGNPMDWNQNGGAFLGTNTDSKEAVLAAMAAAGIPPGADVAIVGHSQGGIVAANIAADPKVNGAADGYNVTDVITFGSPVEQRPAVNDTKSINFHNEPSAQGNGRDPVPHIDENVKSATDPRNPDPFGGPRPPIPFDKPNHQEVALPSQRGGNTHNTEFYIESLPEASGESKTAVDEYMDSPSMQNYKNGELSDTVDVSVSRDEDHPSAIIGMP